MKTTILIIFCSTALLFFVLLLDSCAKCEQEVIKLKDLNAYVPYSGTDTIRFFHNNTDTQLFVGLGIERFSVGKFRNESCPPTLCESMRISFKNTQSNAMIRLEYLYTAESGYRYLFNYNKWGLSNLKGGSANDILVIGDHKYSYVNYYSSYLDTVTHYIAYCYSFNNKAGIIKIKFPGDTLTLIR